MEVYDICYFHKGKVESFDKERVWISNSSANKAACILICDSDDSRLVHSSRTIAWRTMAVASSAREKDASLRVRLYARLVYTVTTSTSRAPEVAIFTSCTVPWQSPTYGFHLICFLSFFSFTFLSCRLVVPSLGTTRDRCLRYIDS
jgi:hypothetical protein